MDNYQKTEERYKRSRDAVASTLDGSVCLFNIRSCEYFSLNETGSDIWNCLESPATASEIAIYIAEQYEISFEEGRSQIEAWLLDASKHGVIDVVS